MKASEFGGPVPDGVGKWCFGRGDTFQNEYYGTREEAHAAGKAYYADGRPFIIGFGREVSFAGVYVDSILEGIAEACGDQVGDVAVGYLDGVTAQHRGELQGLLTAALADWLTRHNLWPTRHNVWPTFYHVTNLEAAK